MVVILHIAKLLALIWINSVSRSVPWPIRTLGSGHDAM